MVIDWDGGLTPYGYRLGCYGYGLGRYGYRLGCPKKVYGLGYNATYI